MAEPSTETVVRALKEIAHDLALAPDRMDLFVAEFGPIIWRCWYPLTCGRRMDGDDVLCAIENLEGAARCVNRLSNELDAGPAENWSEHQLGEGFAEYRAKLADLLGLVDHLKEAAEDSKRLIGGQPADQRTCPAYYAVAEELCRAALAASVRLTTNKNNVYEGSLPDVLCRIASLLPNGLVPKDKDGLSASALDRIRRKVDAESNRAA